MTSDDGQKVKFKYSRNQQSIRMRYNENYGVYVLDEGCFDARKFAIRNVYGSEIGQVSKGLWRETTGTLTLNDVPGKIIYQIDVKKTLIEIRTGSDEKYVIHITDGNFEENFMLSLIVFSWMQAVSAVPVPVMF